MKNAEKGKEFYFHDGTYAKNLKELVEHLKKMDNNEFFSYVNDYKNDFSNWIKDVLGYRDLAEDIREVKDKNQTIKILENYIEKYAIGESHKKREKHSKKKPGRVNNEIDSFLRDIHYKPYSKLVRELLLKEFFLGVIYGFIVALILFAALRALQIL